MSYTLYVRLHTLETLLTFYVLHVSYVSNIYIVHGILYIIL